MMISRKLYEANAGFDVPGARGKQIGQVEIVLDQDFTRVIQAPHIHMIGAVRYQKAVVGPQLLRAIGICSMGCTCETDPIHPRFSSPSLSVLRGESLPSQERSALQFSGACATC